MPPFSYKLLPSPGTRGPLVRSLFQRQDLKLDHFRLPAASLRHDNLPAHMLAVQTSPTVRFHQRFGGRNVSGWMAARHCVIAPAGSSSVSTWDDPREVHVLSLAPALFDRLLQEENGGAPVELVHRHIGQDPFIAEAVRMMARHAADREPLGSLFLDGLTLALVAHLARHNVRRPAPPPKGGLTHRQLRRVLDYMEDRLGEDVSLRALAAEAGLSERYFCTAFGQTVGTPPYRYMIERRIVRAKDMLLNRRDMRVTDIAMAVGFPTSAHFATTFRSFTGITPTAFRGRDQ